MTIANLATYMIVDMRVLVAAIVRDRRIRNRLVAVRLPGVATVRELQHAGRR